MDFFKNRTAIPDPGAAAGVEHFLKASLAREAGASRAPEPPDGGAAAWAGAQGALEARIENDIAALAREQRDALARLEARLAEAERAARDLAGQVQELR